jgi:arylsulfatase A-like enzyme
MARRIQALIAVLLVLGASGLLGCGGRSGSVRPNLVVILIDTLRADRLGAYGFELDTSPELDALAAEGVRFDRVVSPTSWTRPAVASLLTSLPPRTLGIYYEHDDGLDDRFATLAEVLWAGGYWTIGATANPNINSSFHFDQGFDEYVDSNVLWMWMGAEPNKFSETEQLLPLGRDIYEKTLNRLRKSDRRPFYAQVSVMEVHEHARYDERSPRPDEAALFPGHPERDYLRAVRQATREAVEFIRAVEQLPGGENTLFVVTSDHGEGLDSHPSVSASDGHGMLLYESNLRVPLIVYDPSGRLPRGHVVTQDVRLLDLMPTLLAYAGLPGPEEMEGTSLLPLMLAETDRIPLPEVFVAETRFRGQHKIAAYSPDWKYIENRDGHKGLPYISLDAMGVMEDGFRTSVYDDHPTEAAALRHALRRWEREHPQVRRTPTASAVTLDERVQLEMLGYAPAQAAAAPSELPGITSEPGIALSR